MRLSEVTGSPNAFAGFSLNIISSSRSVKPCARIASKTGMSVLFSGFPAFPQIGEIAINFAWALTRS